MIYNLSSSIFYYHNIAHIYTKIINKISLAPMKKQKKTKNVVARIGLMMIFGCPCRGSHAISCAILLLRFRPVIMHPASLAVMSENFLLPG